MTRVVRFGQWVGLDFECVQSEQEQIRHPFGASQHAKQCEAAFRSDSETVEEAVSVGEYDLTVVAF